MGTYYSLGVIHTFKATSNQRLTNQDWVRLLEQRLDVSLFDLQITDFQTEGKLQPGIFEENITDFYGVLKNILGKDRNENIDYYEEEYGLNLEKYQNIRTSMRIESEDDIAIKIECTCALLFIEGKVLVEVFYTDPILINWLFRHSTIENKLAGCIVSGIVG